MLGDPIFLPVDQFLASPQQILTTLMTRIVVDKCTHHAQPHFGVFFNTISTSKKMCLLKARAEKGIAGHIEPRSVVWTLIDNGKLTTQIVRVAAIMVKT